MEAAAAGGGCDWTSSRVGDFGDAGSEDGVNPEGFYPETNRSRAGQKLDWIDGWAGEDLEGGWRGCVEDARDSDMQARGDMQAEGDMQAGRDSEAGWGGLGGAGGGGSSGGGGEGGAVWIVATDTPAVARRLRRGTYGARVRWAPGRIAHLDRRPAGRPAAAAEAAAAAAGLEKTMVDFFLLAAADAAVVRSP